MRFLLVTVGIVALAAGCAAQDWESKVRALRPINRERQEEAVLDDVQSRAKQALAAISHAQTQAEADRLRPELRRKLRESLGLERLPWPPDLRTRHVGTLEREGYRIEKLVWQTLPGVEVPAHLYLPAGVKSGAPAVLFYNGHWWPDSKTRPDFQAFCINMARLGFVVLSFDPFGQGERGQSTRDHRRTEMLLVGVSQQGIAEYETQCALKYLLTRKEVDPKRIGITGASGGGYNSWITAALDDRIAVAVPVVGTSDFYEQIAAVRPLDWYRGKEHCHFVPSLIQYADNHELLAMAAPRPVMIISASEDESFPVNGVRKIADYGKALYGDYGAAEKIGYFEDASTGHGYQVKKREAAYGWFLKWLMEKGDGSPYAEPPTETLPFDAEELRCFPVGENRAAGPGIVEAANRIQVGKREKWPRIEVAHCSVDVKDLAVQRLDLCGTPAYLVRPQGKQVGVLVAVDDNGKEALAGDPVVKTALARGWAVIGIDPRGIGERSTAQVNWLAASSLLLGDWYVRRQAADILSAMQSFPGGPVALYARGDNAGLAAAVALNEGPVAWFVLRDAFLSFRAFIERPKQLAASYALRHTDEGRVATYDREIPFFYVPFRALERTDIAEMLGESPGIVISPINGDWEEMEEAAARALLPQGVRTVTNDTVEHALRELMESRTTAPAGVR